MSTLFTFAHRRSLVCACLTGGLLLSQVSACTSWRVQNVAAQQFTIRDATKPVRIVRRDGSVLTLYQPRISGDTLYGTSGPSRTSLSGPLLAIPLSDARSIAVRQAAGGKTALLIVGLSLVVGAAVVAYVFYADAENGIA